MKKFGGFLVLAGILSFVLYYANYNLRILMWVDNWGESTGMIIRGGLVLLGGVLYLMGGASQKRQEKQVETHQEAKEEEEQETE